MDITIEYMNEKWNGIFALFAKGHHNRDEFLQAAKAWCEDNPDFGDDYSGMEDHRCLQDTRFVHHTICRVIPASPSEQEATGHSYLYYYPRPAGERGSFPMTVVELF